MIRIQKFCDTSTGYRIFVGFSLDYLVAVLGLPWPQERLIENVIEGALFIAMVYSVLRERDRRLRRRFKEVGYLNHHIRNSLTVIEMAEGYVSEAEERLQHLRAHGPTPRLIGT